MNIDIEKMRLEMRQENKRFLVQCLLAAGALLAGGAALATLAFHLLGALK